MIDRCGTTDLPVDQCAHCHPGPRPSQSITGARWLHSVTHPHPDGDPAEFPYQSRVWQVPYPKPISCTHTDTTGLCGACAQLLGLLLLDVPALVADLQLALSGQVRFVDRGHVRNGTNPAPETDDMGKPINPDDHGPVRLPFSEPAAAALRGLQDSLGGEPVRRSVELRAGMQTVLLADDIQATLHKISTAVAKAHRVIDRPPNLFYYGHCPVCGEEIWQERITAQDRKYVVCPDMSCPYAADLALHQRAAFDEADDQWLTVTELVAAFTENGQPITRQKIENMIYRQGLPRESRIVPRWERGRLMSKSTYVYRLGDVRDLMIENERKRATG